MRILQLCLRVPFPARDGGTIAMHNLTESLSNSGNEVRILAFNTRKHHIELETIPFEYRSKYDLKLVYLDATVKPIDAFLNLFGSKSYNVSRFDSPDMHIAIRDVLIANPIDVVLVESLFMLPYVNTIRKHSKAKIVYRAHNIEHLIWQRMTASATNPFVRLYLRHLAKRLKAFETNCKNHLDAIVTLTKEDASWFESDGYAGPLLVSPVGLDVMSYSKMGISKNCHHMFHLGSMDWMPNLEGVEWFLNKVWPVLEKKHPQLILHIAGKGMPQKYFDMQTDRLRVYGYVDDVTQFMSGKQLMVVPLFSGSGMRVKIIEGMAAARTIVSTTIGAEGIDIADEHGVLIADNVDAFVNRIDKCLLDMDYARKVANTARAIALEKYDREFLANQFCDFLKTIQ